ncbi:hypothetical protein AJ78_08206 [Emergomyces pasteurianus Ep9510]|uniref:Aminoglycoside phosphotransferase domain-containing protein n=1 Tax=Emergomyces pasteurianus Ep9510 TaxID=1447872 RepID=A0A1J9Q6W8_9EURO|nr:hypothetical protein AJ78_08206 [Emergomyces pasteurianus Ep9510]
MTSSLSLPPAILRSFSLPVQSTNTAQLLPGGQGNSILLPHSNVVLKRIQDAAEAEHAAAIQHQLYHLQAKQEKQKGKREYQVAEPLVVTSNTATTVTNDGDGEGAVGATGYVAGDTWTAARVIPGRPDPGTGRWEEILHASRALHRDLRELFGGVRHFEHPSFMRERGNRWAMGDRVAWELEEAGGEDVDVRTHTIPTVSFIAEEGYKEIFRQLISLREPIDMTKSVSQLVHGDMTGNVLFTNYKREYSAGKDEGEEQEHQPVPGIIDFSLYFRPVEFAEAVIVADGLLWYDAGEELVRLVGVDRYRLQMLVRALIFRLVASSEGERETGIVDEVEQDRFKRAVGLVGRLLRDV